MRFPLLIAAAIAVTASACAPLRSHQGYVVDADLLNSVQPGVDNRQSVLATLGQPSFASQFNQGDWYYISRDSRNYAFNTPKPKEQVTVQISFDQNGNVSAIRKSGVEQVASVSPAKRTTPTLGRDRGFFADLFGNIGTVGAAGAGAGPGGR
ncbi:outer membrane protein assembly factor BamE [Sphingomonas sp.]|jgi:outer membrane protein assembly factor BamE (lipoprotein component of BamABCDE complex)|uniref:outer membrane protein assembly factor BamE n=1 Tax=Sphingomonas sp. TaxID=28214 RepID=UPI00262A776F|nr:outer membrane protein assembly factor BamE [Sphingomonas sp.]MDF2493670.1 cell envelope protein SmpA [Sphingomonas sp.]